MKTDTVATIITEITEPMIVEECVYGTPELAQSNGERIAGNYTRRGYPHTCVGVVAYRNDNILSRDYSTGGDGSWDWKLNKKTIAGYQAVLIEEVKAD